MKSESVQLAHGRYGSSVHAMITGTTSTRAASSSNLNVIGSTADIPGQCIWTAAGRCTSQVTNTLSTTEAKPKPLRPAPPKKTRMPMVCICTVLRLRHTLRFFSSGRKIVRLLLL